MENAQPLPLLISIEETQRQLGDISRASVNRLLRDKKLAGAKVGRRHLIFFSSVRKLAEDSTCGE